MADLAEIGIRANTGSLQRAIQALERFGDKAEQTERRVRTATTQFTRGFDRTVGAIGSLQGALAGFGAGLAIQQTLKTFSNFEQQLINVGKTADIQGQRLDALGERIQGVAREVPVATQRLLELATAAGQVGVKGVDDITRFAETLGKLETATDIAGEQGARSLARLLNITGESASNIDRLGSTLVALGNNLAATEQEIVRTSTFLGAATSQFDLTSSAVAGLSGAMVALGQRAETTGSSVGAALNEISRALANGGENMQALQRITGQTAQELEDAFGQNALAVLLDFAEGLSDVSDSARLSALEDFNLAGRETQRVLNALIDNTSKVREALALANTEFSENQALNIEAARAAESFQSQMQFLDNAVNEAAVTIGGALAPEIVRVANNLTDFIQEAEDLGRIEDAARGLGDAFGYVVDNSETILRLFNTIIGTRLGAAFGPWGAAVGALAGFFAQDLAPAVDDATRSIREHKRALDNVVDSSDEVSESLKRQITRYRELGDAASQLTIDQQIAATSNEIARLQNELSDLEEGGAMVDPSGLSGQRTEQTQQRIREVELQLKAAREEQSRLLDEARAFAQLTRQEDIMRPFIQSVETFSEAVGGPRGGGQGGDGATGELKIFGEETGKVNEQARERLRSITDSIEALETEATNQGRLNAALQTGQERYEEVTQLIEAENKVRELGLPLYGKEHERILDLIQIRDRHAEEIAEEQRAISEANSRIEQAFDDSTRGADEFSSVVTGAFEDAGKSIKRSFVDAITEGEDLLGSLVNVAKRAAVEIAAAFATQQISLNLRGVVNDVSGGGGGGTSAGSALGDLFGVGRSATGTGTQFINQIGASSGIFNSAVTTANPAVPGGLPFLQGPGLGGTEGLLPTTAGSFIGGAAAGFGAGSLANRFLFKGGEAGTIGSGIGAAGGAAIGSLVPGVGTLIGGLVGGVGGAGIGSLFADEKFPFASGLAQAQEGRLGQAKITGLDEGPTEEVQQAFNQITGTINSLADALGGRVTQGVRFGRASGRNPNVPDGFFADIGPQAGALQEPADITGENAEQVLTKLLRRVFTDEGVVQGVSDAVAENVRTAIKNSDASDPQALAEDIRFAQAFTEAFQPAEEQASPFIQQLNSMRDRFEELRAKAEELGLSTEDLTDRFEEAIQSTRAGQRFSLLAEARGVSGPAGQLSQFGAGLGDLRQTADELGLGQGAIADVIETRFRPIVESLGRDQLQGLITTFEQFSGEVEGSDTILAGLRDTLDALGDSANQLTEAESAVVEARRDAIRAMQRERQELVEERDTFRDLARGLRDTRRDLALSDVSPLSPQRRFNEAERQFEQVLQRAQRGDEDALRRLQDVGPQFVREATSFFGATTDQAEVFRRVQDALENSETVAEQQVSRLNTQINQLDAQISNQRSMISQLTGINEGQLSIEQALQNVAEAVNNLSFPTGGGGGSVSGSGSPFITGGGSSATAHFPGGGSHTVSGPNARGTLESTYPDALIGFEQGGTTPGGPFRAHPGEAIFTGPPSFVMNARETARLMGQQNSSSAAMLDELRRQSAQLTQMNRRLARLEEQGQTAEETRRETNENLERAATDVAGGR